MRSTWAAEPPSTHPPASVEPLLQENARSRQAPEGKEPTMNGQHPDPIVTPNPESSATGRLASSVDKGGFWAVVPAGGSGTRLWPVSRSSRPKFLLPLVRADRSLIQETVDRLHGVCDLDRILVVTGPSHAASVARQLPELDARQIIVEPSPKGTGPAIALAAALIARRDPTAVMGSFAADHEVREPARFEQAVRDAIVTARDGWMVTIGLTPTRPETGYGYIERGERVLPGAPVGNVYEAVRFVEKPDRERAAAFVESGRFLWNASMFIWRVDVFMDELWASLPDVAAGVTRIAAAWDTAERDAILGEVWPALPDVTIDNGVMEKCSRFAVVEADMGWSDVGDWDGLGTLLSHDDHGNSVHGDFVGDDCSNNVVWSDTGRVVSIVGLDDVVVVDTEDALLITDRRHAQDVRTTVKHLKALNRSSLV
jgi:mannose-1-phosphate guanylyltransferase